MSFLRKEKSIKRRETDAFKPWSHYSAEPTNYDEVIGSKRRGQKKEIPVVIWVVLSDGENIGPRMGRGKGGSIGRATYPGYHRICQQGPTILAQKLPNKLTPCHFH